MLVSEGRDFKNVVIVVDSQRCVNFCCASLLSHLSRVRLFATIWTVAHQAPLSVGFSRQGYWSGLPFPLLGDVPDPGVEPRPPALQVDSLSSEPPGKPFSLMEQSRYSAGHLGGQV